VQTAIVTHTLSLLFTGREAVLSLNRQELSFTDCLVGNVYYETIEVLNAGDIEYPIQLSIVNSHELQLKINELEQQERNVEDNIRKCGRGMPRRKSVSMQMDTANWASSNGEIAALPANKSDVSGNMEG
jgi:hypothetical protein